MKYLDLTPTDNCQFQSRLGAYTYRFSMLWTEENGWLMSIEKAGLTGYSPLVQGRAMRLDVDCFFGLGEAVQLIPRKEEPNQNNINKTCFLEVLYVD